eukprot:CAMPEP_0194159556 /NCGR_PEP_ID=MMETSP0152-20130528/77901_1 /TAXON_ID=1049557 /ORGANISM="Thalassiothrix antarctica, Strain L6-D1" /LENGTH=282 /DNA_ID=CAMNT_0038869141 /DNA_START=645 /DNA_END=1493 /DNA_ORIENTATION=-
MAFDRPLEADKVNDLGLFSSFIRAPVVGVLMWALGGDEAKRIEEEQQERELIEQLTGEQQQHNNSNDGTIPASRLKEMINHNRKKKNGLKALPRLISSDLSDFSDLGPHQDSEDDDEVDNITRKVKKMSWSDESHKNTRDEIKQTSRTHSPQHHSKTSSLSSTQPIKSVMKRSRSSRVNNSLEMAKLNINDTTTRFLPNGLSSGHGGIIYPTNPNGQTGSGSVSPDGWGWYITTTPPTPEMYKNTKKIIGIDSFGLGKGTLTNPAFKTGSQKTAMGWPSVPL